MPHDNDTFIFKSYITMLQNRAEELCIVPWITYGFWGETAYGLFLQSLNKGVRVSDALYKPADINKISKQLNSNVPGITTLFDSFIKAVKLPTVAHELLPCKYWPKIFNKFSKDFDRLFNKTTSKDIRETYFGTGKLGDLEWTPSTIPLIGIKKTDNWCNWLQKVGVPLPSWYCNNPTAWTLGIAGGITALYFSPYIIPSVTEWVKDSLTATIDTGRKIAQR